MGEATQIITGKRNDISDIAGLNIGAAHDEKVRTGVTLIVPHHAAVAACAVSGGGTGTRETDALKPENLVSHADAIVLAGGSVFGLEAASALTNIMAAQGRGFPTGAALPSPIIPAAILFDMANGGNKDWADAPPYGGLARAAYAARNTDVQQGNFGAGYGALAGQLKGGQGSASACMANNAASIVGALVVANPVGAVVDDDGRFFAQPLAMQQNGALEFGHASRAGEAAQIGGQHPFANSKLSGLAPMQNTSIGVVAVAADLSVAEARRLAIMAQDGLARAIRPVHTPFDGDTIFVLATGEHKLAGEAAARPAALAVLGALAADCVARAVARAVWQAQTLGDMICYHEQFKP
ncbi:MAG: P1 family peptidase [Parvibaculales bacterium]